MSIATIRNIQFVERLNDQKLVCRKSVRYDAEYTDGSVVRCLRLWKEIPNPKIQRNTQSENHYHTFDCSRKKVGVIQNWIVDHERSKGREVPAKPQIGSLQSEPTQIEPSRVLTRLERLELKFAAKALRDGSINRQNNRRIAESEIRTNIRISEQDIKTNLLALELFLIAEEMDKTNKEIGSLLSLIISLQQEVVTLKKKIIDLQLDVDANKQKITNLEAQQNLLAEKVNEIARKKRIKIPVNFKLIVGKKM